MANSITSGGTSRTIFGLFTNDIDTSGDITASAFAGNGLRITNLSATNITSGILRTINGGTGNISYLNNGITYYYNNAFVNNTNLQWINNKLIINQRDFLSDTSNYVKSTSNNLINLIGSTNILESGITNVSNYVLSTSNILINQINTGVTNNVSYPATEDTLGSVKIGDGIYVNIAGVISVMPEIINTTYPTNNTNSSTPILNTNYNVLKFIYDPLLGTTFDRNNINLNVLPVWLKFISANTYSMNGVNLIRNVGYNAIILTDLELYGGISIKPTQLNIEYTPLNITYLELNGIAGTATYCKFEENFSLFDIFKASNIFKTDWALTISFWLKVNFSNNEIIILDFNNGSEESYRKLNITYVNNTLIFYINDNIQYFSIPNIYTQYWNHIVWSFEKNETIFKILVYINGIELRRKERANDFLLLISFINFRNNTISSLNNTSFTYNFCISDFKIYNYALNINEITELYNANNFTQYIINFSNTDINNPNTICDILAYGGGGGGSKGASSNYGGGAGKLIYVNDAHISPGIKTLKVGRGGSGYYSDPGFNQVSSIGNNTSFENLIADGGGTSSNYKVNNILLTQQIIGGCGSGSNGDITTFNITTNLYNFLGQTSNIYIFGNKGGACGGGGIGSVGGVLNGGIGLFGLDNLINNNTDSYKFFNFDSSINFKTDFNLINNEIGELNNENIYIGCGGAGNSNINNITVNGTNQLGYNSLNSGCGGRYGEHGKNGAFLLRFLTKIDRNILPKYIKETSNYVTTSSNNIINYVKNITSVNGNLLWTISNNNLYYNIGNVGIGIDPTDFKFEVATGTGTTGTIANRYFNILSGASGAILSVTVTGGGITNYTSVPTVVFTPVGGGTGATATAVVSSGKITSVIVTGGGSGYTSPPTVSFTGGGGTGATATAAIVSSAVITSNVEIKNVCAKFNSSIWIAGGGSVIASSDKRIKEDIEDINDDTALNMILAIEPKTYKYIDKITKGDNNVYGFIAQQIKDVIPNAVKIQSEFIPNILSVADYNHEYNILTLPSTLPWETINIKVNTRIKCYDTGNNAIIAEIIEIINLNTFKVKKINYINNKIFVYGVEVNDFHALNKEYINTLNVCAVQELNRKILLQQNQINDLTDKITDLTDKISLLLNYIDVNKISSFEDNINTLNSKYDALITCIDFSK